MKSIFITITIILSSIFGFSQEYPRLDTDSIGNRIVIMTVEQAQKIDNSLDLLFILEKLMIDFSKYDEVTMKVIDDQNYLIISQKVEISLLNESLKNKNEQIDNLKEQLENHKTQLLLSNKQLLLKDDVIKEKDEKIGKLKAQKIIGGFINVVAIVIIIILVK
jgi:hypothetical protein